MASATDKRLTEADLSPDQKACYDSILDWISGSHDEPGLLTFAGFAGCGKTSVVGVLALELQKRKLQVAYAAYTGRASSILGRKLTASGATITSKQHSDDDRTIHGKWGHLFDSLNFRGAPAFVGTIHRLLYRPIINSLTEELLGWRKRSELDRSYDLIVVDECFDAAQRVLTEDGWIKIGPLVNKKLPVRVWSLNLAANQLELKPVVRWLRRPAPVTLLEIDVGRTNSMRDARLIRCTPAHKILTPSGYKRAGSLKEGGELIVRGRHLTSLQFSILVGSMIGDGSMGRHTTRNSPQPMFMHGEEQLDYLKYKKAIFGEDMTGPLQEGSSGYVDRKVWRFALNVTDQSRIVAAEMPFVGTTPNGRRRWAPTEKFLSWIDEIALATWFLDNGSIDRRATASYATIHSQRFDEATHKRLVRFLSRRFGLQADIRCDSRGYFYMTLNGKETSKFLQIITPVSPKCMSKKITGACYDPPYVPAANVTRAKISSIKSCVGKSRQSAWIYDLEVADNHNYIAGNVVVSNCSMVTDEMLLDLKQHGVPILAVGDHGQLPPVMGSGELMKHPNLRLEKIHRQAEGNPIIRLAHEVRETGRLTKGVDLRDSTTWDRDFAVSFRPKSELPHVLVDAYENADSPLDVAILCWTNKTRIRLNSEARRARGLAGPPKAGDLMLCLKNYPPIFNGMRGILTSDSVEFRHPWMLTVEVEFPEEGIERQQRQICVSQINRERPFASLDEFHKLGINVDGFHDAGDLFDFGFAMTCHKSQGSGFPHVILYLDRPEEPSSDDWKRWAYTSCTRSSDRLTILV